MRRVFLLCCTAALVGCYGSREEAGEADEAATMSLADMAGKWAMQTMAEASDSVIVSYGMNATATTEGWTMTLPNREPVSLHIVPGGDSVITHGGPYESVLRPGVTVTTESTTRLVDGMLQGWVVARYQGAGADSVMRFRVRGTRAP